jgi:endonuclease/exonuclease/phosphatase family metal-dependent hydrolase
MIKIICLNLWEGGHLLPNILDFLAKESADILMLQEVYNGMDPNLPDNYNSIEKLKHTLNYPHLDFAPALIDSVPEGEVEQGNAIFSQFPLSLQGVYFFNETYRKRNPFEPSEWPTTPRNLQHVTAQVEGKKVELFNFHGVWDLDGDNFSEKRKNMSDVIIKQIKNRSHIVLAGDTNATPKNRAISVVEQYVTSVFGNELKTSFNMRRKDNPGYATACVDMMFTSNDIVIQQKSCPDVDISDHLPLVVTMELR